MVRASLASLLSLLAVVSTARPGFADDTADEADLQFNLGADRYEAGDFKGALEHFLVSNRLVPNRNVLFNIGRSYEQLKRGPDAYRYYAQALDAETDPAVRARLETALARVAPSVAILKVETDPPGATIYLDRKDLGPRGNTPRTLGLPAGKYRVMVEMPGYEPAAIDAPVDAVIGQERRVHLRLEPILATLRVEGEQGASVRLDADDAKVLCTVPCVAPVVPGRHVVLVSKTGFQPAEYPVDLRPKGSASVRAKLQPQLGAVVVNADVRDALITVDGQPYGFTPAVLNVPVGQHVVRIAHSGFRPITQTVEVSTKTQARVDVQLALLEEVTAASRVTESVEDAPASVTIVTRQELRAMGYPSIAEAVRGIRGLYLSDDRSYVTIGVRGFSRPGDYGNRILILLDGQPMNDNYIWSSYVGFDGRVDIEDVERIEVVRGPGSVLYGTSAFFGVINLVTRSREEPSQREAQVSAVEHGVGRARVTAVQRFGKDAGAWVTVSGARGAGRDFFFREIVADPRDPNAETGANGLPVDGNARGVDDFTAGMVTGRAWYKAATIQWFLNSRKKTLPTGEYGTIFGDGRNHFTDTRGMVEARFEPQLSKLVQSMSRAHVNLYDFDGLSTYPAPDGPSRDTYRGRWGGLEQRLVFTPGSRLRATVGGELIRHVRASQRGEADTGPYVFDARGNPGRDDPFTVAAGYVLADATLTDRLKLSGGARLDYYSSLDKFEITDALNPRLAAIIKPYDGGNLKIMAGKAFRAPSVYELYYTSTTQLAPVGLRPEQIFSGEVEFSHKITPTVSAIVAGFTNYVDRLIELQEPTPGINQYANSKSPVLVYGGEAEVRREWRAGWMVAATTSVQKARYLDDPTLRDVPNSPDVLGSVKGAVPIIGRSVMGMTRLTIEGPRPDRNVRDTDPPQGRTETGVIWDLVLSGEAEKLGVRYNLGAYNLMDWKYSTVPSGEFRQRTIVQNGRTVLASVTVVF